MDVSYSFLCLIASITYSECYSIYGHNRDSWALKMQQNDPFYNDNNNLDMITTTNVNSPPFQFPYIAKKGVFNYDQFEQEPDFEQDNLVIPEDEFGYPLEFEHFNFKDPLPEYQGQIDPKDISYENFAPIQNTAEDFVDKLNFVPEWHDNLNDNDYKQIESMLDAWAIGSRPFLKK